MHKTPIHLNMKLKKKVFLLDKNNQNEYVRWFEKADQDLESAIFLMKMIPVPIEIICYHCQQSAEKYLKAFLFFKKEPVKKTHDLTVLYKTCLKYDRDFKTIEDACLNLTPYSVVTRYPYNIEFDENDVESAIKNAIKIKNLVLSKI